MTNRSFTIRKDHNSHVFKRSGLSVIYEHEMEVDGRNLTDQRQSSTSIRSSFAQEREDVEGNNVIASIRHDYIRSSSVGRLREKYSNPDRFEDISASVSTNITKDNGMRSQERVNDVGNGIVINEGIRKQRFEDVDNANILSEGIQQIPRIVLVSKNGQRTFQV